LGAKIAETGGNEGLTGIFFPGLLKGYTQFP
jgi:hypothetical protein